MGWMGLSGGDAPGSESSDPELAGDRRRGPVVARVMAAGLVAWMAAACATGPAAHRVHPDRDLLTREDLESTHFMYAYEAVEALRSNWLLDRPNTLRATQNQVLVYMDNVRLGGLSELRAISLRPVYYIRYYDSLQATTRWGVDHTQGVIFVSTHPF